MHCLRNVSNQCWGKHAVCTTPAQCRPLHEAYRACEAPGICIWGTTVHCQLFPALLTATVPGEPAPMLHTPVSPKGLLLFLLCALLPCVLLHAAACVHHGAWRACAAAVPGPVYCSDAGPLHACTAGGQQASALHTRSSSIRAAACTGSRPASTASAATWPDVNG